MYSIIDSYSYLDDSFLEREINQERKRANPDVRFGCLNKKRLGFT